MDKNRYQIMYDAYKFTQKIFKNLHPIPILQSPLEAVMHAAQLHLRIQGHSFSSSDTVNI